VAVSPLLTAQAIDRNLLVAFDSWVGVGELYDRFQRFVRFGGASATLDFHGAAQSESSRPESLDLHASCRWPAGGDRVWRLDVGAVSSSI
jgi:hypothetical protein